MSRDIRPQARNANRHTQRGMQALETSISQDGWIGAITVAADGETFDGSARVEKTAENGMLDEAIVVDSDGTRPIVVRRTDIPTATDERAVRLGIAANRVASLNLEWEPDILAAIADSGVDLSSLFTADEWADVAMPALPDAGAGGDDFDATPEDGPTRTALGELWTIGGVHRLLVGDCTDPANVARLMGGERADMVLTDPPYRYKEMGESAAFPGAHRMLKVAIQDLVDFDPSDFLGILPSLFDGKMNAYIFCNADLVPDYCVWARSKGFNFNILTWHKTSFIPAAGNHHFPDTEYLIYISKDAVFNSGLRVNYGKYWVMGNEKSEDHPTIKPLEILETEIQISSNVGAIVADFYAGSGTTLIAAHRTGRRCYGMEIAPRYADVILRRAEAEQLECKLLTYEMD